MSSTNCKLTDQEIIEKIAVEVLDRDLTWVKLTGWDPINYIADAFMVVEKIPQTYWYELIRTKEGKYIFNIFESYISFKDWIKGKGVYQESDTPQRAICMAAIKWLEAKDA